MRYTVFIFPLAVLQLEEMAGYLDEHRSGYGQLFLNEFNDTIEYLESFAHAPAKKRKEFRQVLIGRFKVLAIYELCGNDVYIYNVIHGSRHPSKRYRKRKLK